MLDPLPDVERTIFELDGIRPAAGEKFHRFLVSAPIAAVAGAPAISSAFALGAIEPIPNKIGEIAFQRRF